MKPILAALVAVALGLSVTSINANNPRVTLVLQSSDGTTVLQKEQGVLQSSDRIADFRKRHNEQVDRSQPVKECDHGECSYRGSPRGPCTW